MVYWKRLEEDQLAEEPANKPTRKAVLRYYFVFNISQCTGIPASRIPETIQPREIDTCEQIIQRMPQVPEICHKEQKAYYSVYFDYINMPKKETFASNEAYYAVLLHELIHSTGHETRLARREIVEMSGMHSSAYSIEELTAELGACYLASYAGIAPAELENSAAYIAAWLKRLENDKRFVVHAAAQAQRAVDFILNVRSEENDLVPSLSDAV